MNTWEKFLETKSALIDMEIRVELFIHTPCETNTNWHWLFMDEYITAAAVCPAQLVDK